MQARNEGAPDSPTAQGHPKKPCTRARLEVLDLDDVRQAGDALRRRGEALIVIATVIVIIIIIIVMVIVLVIVIVIVI